MKNSEEKEVLRPPQHQASQPGTEKMMFPKPESEPLKDRKAGKLEGKTAIITGGDSGIGKAVALAFAEEGADCVISYLEEHKDAEETEKQIKERGREALLIAGDIADEAQCRRIIEKAVSKFGKIDILVNNAAVQFPRERLEDILSEQLEKTFRINIFSQFYMTKAALPHMREGSAVINTTSVTAYRGSKHLMDYAATKGAIVAFTRSLSSALTERKIRVNGVAPGPVWTPLIPSSFSADQVAEFGSDVPMKRAGEPNEIAPCYVFLASSDASYMTGQVLHPNGGEIING